MASPEPPPYSAWPESESVPLYDLDEIIAGLTLDDGKSFSSCNCSNLTSAEPGRSHGSPPAHGRARARSPPATPSLTSRTVYQLSSPAGNSILEDWCRSSVSRSRIFLLIQLRSAAGFTAQRTPNSQVKAVRKVRTPTRAKRAYVVFWGQAIGVFDTWEQAKHATSGVRFALHQGYPSREEATRAFKFARRKGWTCASLAWVTGPVSGGDAPQPVVQEDGAAVLLSGRQIGDPCVECALNVLGIRGSMHEKVPGFAEARDKFHRAREAGHIRRILVAFSRSEIYEHENHGVTNITN
ncbi:hypothetical protein B0H14DRAFT_2609508 [Mycena olivaceomarginata]|nr:hypothetical protein B0H14DRAFT_2609508 [Mycena olivaceomarginata]